MFQLFSRLPVVAGAPLFVGGVVLLSVLGGIAFHRFIPKSLLIEHNEIAGFVFAVVGVIYAVLLAFLAVGAWEHLQTAEQQTYEEAARLAVVYRECDIFPQRHALRAEIRAYVEELVTRDWPMMQHGEEDPRALGMGERIAFEIRHLPLKTIAEQNVHAAMINSMDEALIDRDTRESLARTGIGVFLWAILIAGGVVTIGFSYLFAYRHNWLLVAIVGGLGAMVGLILYLIAAVDYPFSGEIRVGPEAFENILHVFRVIGQ